MHLTFLWQIIQTEPASLYLTIVFFFFSLQKAEEDLKEAKEYVEAEEACAAAKEMLGL